MNVRLTTPWQLGFLVILLFVLIGELSVIFDDYVFYRVGVNRNVFLFVLWILPAGAAFIASYFSRRYKLLSGLSYAIVLPILGATAHYVSGQLGAPTDFAGLRGAFIVFKIHFVLGAIAASVGTTLGLLLSRKRSSQHRLGVKS